MTTFNDTEVQELLNNLERLVTDTSERRALLTTIGERVGTLAEGFAQDEMYPERREGVPLELFYTRTSEAKKPYTPTFGEKAFNPQRFGGQRQPGAQFQSKFKSRKQQAYVIMLAKKGKIPRKRTGQLGNSITHIVTAVDAGVIVQVGTNKKYAKYPLGDEGEQNHYLASLGWKPLASTIGAHVQEYRAAIVEGLRGIVDYLKGNK